MPLDILTIPCRRDNYAFLLHNADRGLTALVDAPELAPIEAALRARGWGLDLIALTHHHHDHVEAVAPLCQAHGASVAGARADAHRLPPLDIALDPGDSLDLAGEPARVLDVPGHTLGHIAFHLPGAKAVFTGDSLMAMGCGRLFEGTAAMMWDSLTRLAALPPDTMVCSGHEYTASNARFAMSIDPDNPALATRMAAIDAAEDAGTPTVPSFLGEEMATNPFLRAADPAIRAALGMEDAADAAVFAEIRARKDSF